MVAMPSALNVPPDIGPERSTRFLNPEAVQTPNTIAVSEVTLYAGVTYEMHVIGATEAPAMNLQNPVLGIYTPDFKQLLYAQDDTLSPSSIDPIFTFKPNVTGEYGIGVASAIPGGVGRFLLDIHPIGQTPITFGNLGQF